MRMPSSVVLMSKQERGKEIMHLMDGRGGQIAMPKARATLDLALLPQEVSVHRQTRHG
jgi:hypothetical protein